MGYENVLDPAGDDDACDDAGEGDDSEAVAPPTLELLTAMGRFNEELIQAGVMLAGDGLKPSKIGKRVWFDGASRTINRSSPRMVNRRNSQHMVFQWGAPRRIPIDPTPEAAGPMVVTQPGRTRLRQVQRPWSVDDPGGRLSV